MKRKKLKITIECEGKPTQVFEANGIAAALLTDGVDENHHGLSCLICGCMNPQDLIHLHDGIEEELLDALKTNIVDSLPASVVLEALLGGKKHESEG